MPPVSFFQGLVPGIVTTFHPPLITIGKLFALVLSATAEESFGEVPRPSDPHGCA